MQRNGKLLQVHEENRGIYESALSQDMWTLRNRHNPLPHQSSFGEIENIEETHEEK